MNPRNQVEIKIHKNDYLTISFIGDINFAGRWYGTPETLREKLRSFPHKSERGKVLDEFKNWVIHDMVFCDSIGADHMFSHECILDKIAELRQAGEP
jgi:hypothetical protein